jgi:flagellar protein FlaG
MAIEPLSNVAGAVATGVSAQSRPTGRTDSATAFDQTAPAPAVDVGQVRHAVETINRHLNAAAQNLRFSVDDATGKMVVRVVDTNTGEVIRQVPNEEVLAISRSIDRLQGVLFHQQA